MPFNSHWPLLPVLLPGQCSVCNGAGPWHEIKKGKVKVKFAQSCPTLCEPMDCTVTEFSRPEYWSGVAFPFPRESSQPGDRTQVFCIAGGFFTSWATKEAQEYWNGWPIPSPGDLPDPGIKPGSPALQVDSLPAELSGSCDSLFLVSLTN